MRAKGARKYSSTAQLIPKRARTMANNEIVGIIKLHLFSVISILVGIPTSRKLGCPAAYMEL